MQTTPYSRPSAFATRNAPSGGYSPANHKTWVASAAACNHATLRGMAYNASLIDAAFDPQINPTTHVYTDLVPALIFAVNTNASDVVNASWSYTNNVSSELILSIFRLDMPGAIKLIPIK